jgi:hypothetical protein
MVNKNFNSLSPELLGSQDSKGTTIMLPLCPNEQYMPDEFCPNEQYANVRM